MIKLFVSIFFLLIAMFANAQPASAPTPTSVPTNCRPAKLADVHLVSAGDDFAGWWWCDSTKNEFKWRGILRPAINKDLASLAYAWAATGDQRLFDLVVTLQDNDPKFAALRAAVYADVKIAIPQYVVAKNGTYLDRPVYAHAAAVRNKAAVPSVRALVGSACNCALTSILEASTRYCVAGGGPFVAVCVPKTP